MFEPSTLNLHRFTNYPGEGHRFFFPIEGTEHLLECKRAPRNLLSKDTSIYNIDGEVYYVECRGRSTIGLGPIDTYLISSADEPKGRVILAHLDLRLEKPSVNMLNCYYVDSKCDDYLYALPEGVLVRLSQMDSRILGKHLEKNGFEVIPAVYPDIAPPSRPLKTGRDKCSGCNGCGCSR
ncbi:MAG: hypothetical protein PHY92_02130 [Alphaproteobacteria bacterium]|nr:hypothetical protein [Alphaproteobacteria bacterium]